MTAMCCVFQVPHLDAAELDLHFLVPESYFRNAWDGGGVCAGDRVGDREVGLRLCWGLTW